MKTSVILRPKKCIGCGDLHDESGPYCSTDCMFDYLTRPEPTYGPRKMSGLTAHCRQHNKRQCPKCFSS